MKLIIAILAMGAIIVVHELGHFLSAILFGIRVREFSIGFGPQLFAYKGKLASFSLRMIPLGGYVDLGDLEEENFDSRPYYQKFIVLIAGIVANIIFAFSLFLLVFSYLGQIDRNSNRINRVLSSSSVLKEGDEVIGINNARIYKWEELENLVKESRGALKVRVVRNGELITLKVESKDRLLYDAIPFKRSFHIAIQRSRKAVFEGLRHSPDLLKKLIKGAIGLKELSGPIGIVKSFQDSYNESFVKLLFFMAMVSISIAFSNILPLPPLDGGKLVIISLKRLGLRINRRIENIFSIIGTLLILVLVIYITKSDIQKMREVSFAKAKG